MLRAEPPMFLSGKRRNEKTLRHFTGKTWSICVQGNDLPTPVGQNKQIASCQMPRGSGTILDRGFVVRGHQRAQIAQIGQQVGRMAERGLLLPMKVLEGADRISQVGKNLPLDFRSYTLADQEQAQ